MFRYGNNKKGLHLVKTKSIEALQTVNANAFNIPKLIYCHGPSSVTLTNAIWTLWRMKKDYQIGELIGPIGVCNCNLDNPLWQCLAAQFSRLWHQTQQVTEVVTTAMMCKSSNSQVQVKSKSVWPCIKSSQVQVRSLKKTDQVKSSPSPLPKKNHQESSSQVQVKSIFDKNWT